MSEDRLAGSHIAGVMNSFLSDGGLDLRTEGAGVGDARYGAVTAIYRVSPLKPYMIFTILNHL